MSDLRRAALAVVHAWDTDGPVSTMEDLRAALALPEPEKVAWRFWVGDWQYVCDERMLHHLDKDVFFEPLYTMPPKQRKKTDLSPMQEAAQMLRDRAPPQRKPLTDEEVYALVDATIEDGRCALARAIERAHGIEWTDRPKDWPERSFT